MGHPLLQGFHSLLPLPGKPWLGKALPKMLGSAEGEVPIKVSLSFL
ncbi:hypothetical protein [Thermoactinomyces mirandus]|nr:hypothetical protein [Thermoactinomyces mirandus]